MRRPILVIEDSDEDFEVLKASLRASKVKNQVVRCATGRDVSAFLQKASAMNSGDCPAIILLDLNIPGGDGRNIVRELRGHPVLGAVPVIVLTTSAQPTDIAICYMHGACGYMVKPVDLDLFESMIQKMTDYWLGCVQLVQFPSVHA